MSVIIFKRQPSRQLMVCSEQPQTLLAMCDYISNDPDVVFYKAVELESVWRAALHTQLSDVRDSQQQGNAPQQHIFQTNVCIQLYNHLAKTSHCKNMKPDLMIT